MNCPDLFLQRQMFTEALLRLPCTRAAERDPNRPLFASMLTGQSLGQGCLDGCLGCGEAAWKELVSSYFVGLPSFDVAPPPATIPEWQDLRKLMLDHRGHQYPSEIWMADIIASACAGCDHLWQDLALASRAELTRLMQTNFPSLATANSGDMKWKKFLYRQFCANEGIYVCPAPSCGECIDHPKCFGPER